MPIHLPPLNRREFLRGSAAAAAGVLTFRCAAAEGAKADPHRFVLLSDAHVSANPAEVSQDVNMTDNFRRVVAEVLAEKVQPAAAFLNGDCAFHVGLKDDYHQLATLLDPLRQAGLPLHLSMGNHDDREHFAAALADYRPREQPVAGHYVAVVLAERVNWFLLDSLQHTNQTPGELGQEQLAWLAKALDAHTDKPAIVLCHHNPDLLSLVPGLVKGLIDTKPLLDTLASRKHVKALVFGHTHVWAVSRYQDLHLVNLPPTAYLFSKGRPNGWVSAALKDDGMSLTLNALDKHHPDHGKTVELKWRA